MTHESFSSSEIVIGIVSSVGTDHEIVTKTIQDQLKQYGYECVIVSLSKEIIPLIPCVGKVETSNEYDRIDSLIKAGNKAREDSENKAVLALGAMDIVALKRERDDQKNVLPLLKTAHIFVSLKTPEEVEKLREVYSKGFYLIGVYSEEERRRRSLLERKGMTASQANELIERDSHEHNDFGQRTRETYHLSDFFVKVDEDRDRTEGSVWRILDIIFGHPYLTPTFDEYAMFIAFSASLRSADLSRQVGAVIAKNQEIIAMGSNDCPRFGGGLYWPVYDQDSKEYKDTPGGRDYTRGGDSNVREQKNIIDRIVTCLNSDRPSDDGTKKAIKDCGIGDITEYGRVVHAEMEALLCCSRNGISPRGGDLYCTTFPCHNCAKHIIAAGIRRVVFVEPYPKSKAMEFHGECTNLGFTEHNQKVQFEPFVGVGPRRFFDLFSMKLGSGYPLERKDKNGDIVKFHRNTARIRMQMLPGTYCEREHVGSTQFNSLKLVIEKKNKRGRDHEIE